MVRSATTSVGTIFAATFLLEIVETKTPLFSETFRTIGVPAIALPSCKPAKRLSGVKRQSSSRAPGVK